MRLAHNYVGESRQDAGQVGFGYETTRTATGADGGGVVLLDSTALAGQVRNSEAFKGLNGLGLPCYIFMPSEDAPPVEEESEVLAHGANSDVRVDEMAQKSAQVEVVLRELQKGSQCDLVAVGDAMWCLQDLGGKG